MTARFADVLEISLAMSVVLAVLLALRPLLKKRLRAGAFYWVWLLAALRLCIPFNLSLPQAPVTVEAVPRAVYRVDTVNSNPGNHHYAALTEEEAASEEVAAENRPVDGGSIQDVYTPLFTLEGAVAALWLAGAGAFLAWHLAKYVRFRLRVRRWGAPAEDAALLARFEAAKAELGVKDLALLVCPAVGAPLVTGFVNPALLLPRETVSDGVLRHELIHTRRRDLWYKLLLLLSRSLHWFNPLVHWMAAAASRDLECSCDEAAVAGRDAAFRAAYGAAMLDAVEEGIEARAPLTTHFRGGKAAMKERLLSIASGGTRKKGVALVCAAALVISAGAAACSLGERGSSASDVEIYGENYSFRCPSGLSGTYSSGGESLILSGSPPAGGLIVSPTDFLWYAEGYRRPDFASLVTGYGVELSDEDGNPILPAEAVAVTVEDLSCKIEDLEPDADVPLWTYKVLVERADGREELHTFYLMNQADPNNGIYDLWFDLSQVSREEAEAVRNTLVLGYDRTDSPDGTRLLSIQPWGGDCMLYDISGEHPVALGQVSCSSGMPGGAVHSDPLWSPDGSRVAVTSTGRTIDAGMSFSFPIGPLPPELTHQKEGGLAGLTFAALNPEYQMGDAVGYPRCVPLAWSEDGLSLQYSWAWADTEGQLHEGTAWYCFDENGRFTEIRDVVENDVYPVHG